MIEVYGIPNCDVVKKSLAWLKEHKVDFRFHDFKTEGVHEKKLDQWINKAGLEVVLNKRSTTWKNLPADVQQSTHDKRTAMQVMQAQSSIIKRPVIEFKDKVFTGFSEETFKKFLHK